MDTNLPQAASVLAVCAHPDDETFGLGAVLSSYARAGARTTVLCFTRGEASTLGADTEDLASVRAAEFETAARVLDVERREMLAYPDGGLARVDVVELAAHVGRVAGEVGADLLLVFDEGGITGHPDHVAATAAALEAAGDRGCPVLAWVVPAAVARALNQEFGARFVGRADDEIDVYVAVNRTRQRQAMACHPSQFADNPVPSRRLDLTGDREPLRWLHRAHQRTPQSTAR